MSTSAITRPPEPLLPRDQTRAIAIATAVVVCSLAAVYAPALLGIAAGISIGFAFLERPYPLLLLMVFLIPFNFIVPVGPVPVAAELLKIFAWVPFLIHQHETGRQFQHSSYGKWFLVLGALIVLSLVRAKDLPFTLKESVRLVSNIGLVYLAINLVDTQKKLLQVFRVLAISTFLVALYGFYQWYIQDFGALFWIVNPRLNTSLAHYRDEFWQWRNRMISVLTSEMELGHYFNLCLPIGAFLWLKEGRRRFTSKWLWMTVAMLAGLVLTFTFSAWLALAATCGVFILFFAPGQRVKLIVACTALATILVVLVAFGPLRTVVEAKAGGEGIGSLQWDVATRVYGWKIALQTWREHPFIGSGIGNFESISADYDFMLGANSQGTSPHETYLFLLANFGIIGTAAVLVIMIAAIRSNLQLFRSRSDFGLLGLAIAFALVTNMIGWFGDDSGFFGPHAAYLVWLLLGLSEAARRLATHKPETIATGA